MKTPRDKFEQAVWGSQLSVAILGNPQTRDFALINPDDALSEDVRRDYTRRGFEFLGVFALVEGRGRVALENALDTAMCDAISRAFLGRVEDELNRRVMAQGGGSIEWVRRLYAAPAPGEN
jgi:hypothetical protein